MNHLLASIVLALTFIPAVDEGLAARGKNLVINGSFEDGPAAIPGDGEEINPNQGYLPLNEGSTAIMGWVVTRGQIDLTANHWRAADGRRSIDLNGSPGVGGIEQTINTVTGGRYLLTFKLSGHPYPIEAEERVKTLGVRIGEAGAIEKVFRFDTTGKDRANMGWVERGFEFTATSERTPIEFYSLSKKDRYGGPALDAVQVVEIYDLTPPQKPNLKRPPEGQLPPPKEPPAGFK